MAWFKHTKSKARHTAGIILTAAVALGAFSVSAEAQRWEGRDWHHHHHWDGGYYRSPPVVYHRPYYEPYYPPPVIYGPGIGLNFRIH